MFELLRRAARIDRPRPAILTATSEVTYAELVERAQSTAQALQRRDGQRFAIVSSDAAEVVALLAGASLIGAEACAYAPDIAPDDAAELSARLGHRLVVSDRGDLHGDDVEVVSPADLREHGGSVEASPGERPFLVLTTGTTGLPRAVRQDWGHVLRPFLRLEPSPEERWLFAYGVQQFGGLQMLLHVMAVGATLVDTWPRTPLAGLTAMREHDVDHASATPTYWRFLLSELRAAGGATPQLRQITLGGEAVPTRLLDDLRLTFPEAQISQVYAANESGSVRSVHDGRIGLPASALEPSPDADVELKIVDGELWSRSRVGMLGYYGEEPIDPDAWRPTGDLVEVVDDRILFSGRTSEVINVGGVKVHPLPIEERISAVAGVEMVRVFGRPNSLTGAIVAVEVVGADGVDVDELDGAIRAACQDLPAAARPRSIRFVDALETTGNKMVRRSS